MAGQSLIWQRVDGATAQTPLPHLELDTSACVALHDAFPDVASGRHAGTVRLDPATHKVAGFMIRHEREVDRWRVQHL